MGLSYEEKIAEIRKKALEFGCFPVMHRNDRPNEKYVAKFSNGTDMGTFFSRQLQALRQNNLSCDRKYYFEDLLKISSEFKDKELEKKLEEASEIYKKYEHIPIAKRKKNDPDPRVHQFSDGMDVGTFIQRCKTKLINGKYNKCDEKQVKLFLESENLYKDYKLKARINEMISISMNLGSLPAHKQDDANEARIRSFQDGSDVGHYISHQNNKYKNGLMSQSQKVLWEEFLLFGKKLEKIALLNKINELSQVILETGKIPIKCTNAKENSDNVHQFSDGTDMGIFISKYRKKMRTQHISNFERLAFNKFLRLEKSLEDQKFMDKARYAIKAIIELERFPVSAGQGKNLELIRKFDDGIDIGNWIYRINSKYQMGKISEEKQKIVSDVVNIDLEKVSEWNRGYRALLDYYKNYGDFNVISTYKTKDNFKLGCFMMNNTYNYYSEDKSLLDNIHEEMLSEIDPQWMMYGLTNSHQIDNQFCSIGNKNKFQKTKSLFK